MSENHTVQAPAVHTRAEQTPQEQAADPLRAHRKKFIQRVLREHGLSPDGRKEQLIERVAQALVEGPAEPRRDGTIPLASLDEYLAQSNVVVFPLRWRDPDRVREALSPKPIGERLATIGRSDVWGTEKDVWETEGEPTLCAVSADDDCLLRAKWVESRTWKRNLPGPGLVFQTRVERSINFFVVDAEARTAQIRIQKLQPNPEEKLREELGVYQRQISDLLGEDLAELFVHEPLEPLIRKILLSPPPSAAIWEWKIESPTKGALSGKGSPGVFLGLLEPFGRFLGEEVECRWKLPEGGRPRVSTALKAESNSVEVGKCRRGQARAVLQQLSRLIGLGPTWELETDELKDLARDRPDMLPVLLKLDAYLTSNVRRIEAGRLQDWWTDVAHIREVFLTLCSRYSKAFRCEGTLGDVLVAVRRNGDADGSNDRGPGVWHIVWLGTKEIRSTTLRVTVSILTTGSSLLGLYKASVWAIKWLNDEIASRFGEVLLGEKLFNIVRWVVLAVNVFAVVGPAGIVRAWRSLTGALRKLAVRCAGTAPAKP